jgi:hypothetical protein
MPIGFIGVGIHDYIDPTNVELLDRAKLVITRNHVTDTFYPAIQACDLVFSRDFHESWVPGSKKLLVLGNDFLVPREFSSEWRRAAWQPFLVRFADALEWAKDDGWEIEFYPMQAEAVNDLYTHDDRDFASQVIAEITVACSSVTSMPTEAGLIQAICSADHVWSMRLHGNILSTILGTPFTGISSHDKMLSFFVDNDLPNYVDYYSFTAENLATAPRADPEVLSTITQEGHNQWQLLSATTGDVFAL